MVTVDTFSRTGVTTVFRPGRRRMASGTRTVMLAASLTLPPASRSTAGSAVDRTGHAEARTLLAGLSGRPRQVLRQLHRFGGTGGPGRALALL